MTLHLLRKKSFRPRERKKGGRELEKVGKRCREEIERGRGEIKEIEREKGGRDDGEEKGERDEMERQ